MYNINTSNIKLLGTSMWVVAHLYRAICSNVFQHCLLHFAYSKLDEIDQVKMKEEVRAWLNERVSHFDRILPNTQYLLYNA